MNPDQNTQNTNPTTPTTGANNEFVTPNPIGYTAPQATPMPANNTNVQANQMPSQGVNVTPTPVSTVVSNATEETKEDPNAKLAEVNLPPSASTTAQPQVINTVKKKSGNILLFLVIAILVYFAINIDKMSEMYENYMKTGSLTSTTVTPDNTTNSGYIKIDDSTSSMKLNNINFYNFRKNSSDSSISFNYEAFERYEDASSLGMYIEIYNANKALLYKELFAPQSSVEMNTASNYTMTLESDIYEGAYLALVKVYTDSELVSASTLTCKYTDNNYEYENKYYFTNDSLVSYDVYKKSFSVEDSALEKEYTALDSSLKAKYINATLTYSVNLDNVKGINPVYKKGLTKEIVKNRETLKKWNCE